MLKVLFWNTGRKPLADALNWLCRYHDPDVVILAECGIPDAKLLLTINNGLERDYILPPNDSANSIRFLHRLSVDSWKVIEDRERFAIRTVEVPGYLEFLLVAVHHQSARELPVNGIGRYTGKSEHTSTIRCGVCLGTSRRGLREPISAAVTS